MPRGGLPAVSITRSETLLRLRGWAKEHRCPNPVLLVVPWVEISGKSRFLGALECEVVSVDETLLLMRVGRLVEPAIIHEIDIHRIHG